MAKKKQDKVVIGKLSDKKAEEFISSGITELDELLGGGFYRGRITEISGKESVGKTQIATLLMANMSEKQKVLYIDTEFALNSNRVEQLGANPKNINYMADSRLEAMCELMVDNVGKFDVIILDSIASLTPLTVANAEIGERSIGLFSLLIKHWVLKFRPLLANSKTAFIALNQYRPPIGLYVSEQVPGGKSWHHSCDVCIKITTVGADKVIEKGVPVGHFVHALLKKNRMGIPNREAKFLIKY